MNAYLNWIRFLPILLAIYSCSFSPNPSATFTGTDGTSAPAATILAPAERNLANTAAIRVQFSKSMRPETLQLSGSVADGSSKVDWQANNTLLSVLPAGTWPMGTLSFAMKVRSLSGHYVSLASSYTVVPASAPSYTINLAGGTISSTTTLVISFSKTMALSSCAYYGSMGTMVGPAIWQSTAHPNDRLILNPISTWGQDAQTLSIRCSDAEGNVPPAMDFSYQIVGNALFVHPSGSDTNLGTAALPLKTIQAAIDLGNKIFSSGPGDVKVAEGTYNVCFSRTACAFPLPVTPAQVTVKENVHLLGGYSATDWNVRDLAWTNHVSIISDGSSVAGAASLNPARAVDFQSPGANMLLEGFKIVGSGQDTSTAVFSFSASPVIRSNSLENAGSGANNFALRLGASSAFVESNNLTNALVSDSYGNPTIKNNSIRSPHLGIYVLQGLSIPISGNYIESQDFAALDIREVAGLIANNVMYITASASFSENQRGIFIASNCSLCTTQPFELKNNTIYVKSLHGANHNPMSIINIDSRSALQPQIENNILIADSESNDCTTMGSSICEFIFYQGNIAVGTQGATVKNNVFWAIDAAPWLFNNGNGDPGPRGPFAEGPTATSYAKGAAVMEGASGIAACADKTYCSGNISGVDPKVVSIANKDFRLTTTAPCNVKQGGIDGFDAATAWSFNVDQLNAIRTANTDCNPSNANAGGWSIGAFEQDG
jgi:hypothetical protein